MKKFIFALAIFAFGVTYSVAQTTGFRFGFPPGDDNTGRVLTYAIVTTTDVTSATLDTITLRPNAWETLVCMKTGTAITNLADSVCYKFSSVTTTQRIGDKVTIMLSKGSGNGNVKFGGSVVVLSTASQAVALAANKSLIMVFRWNGRKWIEQSRTVQP